MVPHMARALLVSFAGRTVIRLPSTVTSTSEVIGADSSPSLPFAVTVSFAISTVTPAGTATGYFPTRDIVISDQKTWKRTSPPTLAASHPLADITPSGVDRYRSEERCVGKRVAKR